MTIKLAATKLVPIFDIEEVNGELLQVWKFETLAVFKVYQSKSLKQALKRVDVLARDGYSVALKINGGSITDINRW